MSDKTRKTMSQLAPVRAAWLRQIGMCEACGVEPATDVHEITAGSSRQRAVGDPRCWLALCRECHQEHQSTAIEAQFDLLIFAHKRAINRALGRELL